MKITLNQRNKAFTLCGLIVGCMLLVVGVVVVHSMVRCIKDLQANPRKIPELEEAYPDWQTNSMAPWPEQYAPITRFNLPPAGDVYERIQIACGFYVNICTNGNMKGWQPVLLWMDDPEVGAVSNPWWDAPVLTGFDMLEIDGVTYQMKQDFSGIDIQPSPAFKAANRIAFWGVSGWD